MNADHIRRLFSYDEWANREVLAALRKASPLPRPLEFLAHILSAERLWLERVRRQPQTFAVWPGFTLDDCESQINENAELWKDFFSSVNDSELDGSVDYKNTAGEPWSSRVEDILMHVIMHSAYHRGQIATSLRESGAAPANTDFIHCIRRGLVE